MKERCHETVIQKHFSAIQEEKSYHVFLYEKKKKKMYPLYEVTVLIRT